MGKDLNANLTNEHEQPPSKHVERQSSDLQIHAMALNKCVSVCLCEGQGCCPNKLRT